MSFSIRTYFLHYCRLPDLLFPPSFRALFSSIPRIYAALLQTPLFGLVAHCINCIDGACACLEKAMRVS